MSKTTLPLRVCEFSTSHDTYPMHEVLLTRAGQEVPTGGYVVERHPNGIATEGGGQWWIGVAWSPDLEHGPYRSLPAAAKAVQVITPTLKARGWTA